MRGLAQRLRDAASQTVGGEVTPVAGLLLEAADALEADPVLTFKGHRVVFDAAASWPPSVSSTTGTSSTTAPLEADPIAPSTPVMDVMDGDQ